MFDLEGMMDVGVCVQGGQQTGDDQADASSVRQREINRWNPAVPRLQERMNSPLAKRDVRLRGRVRAGGRVIPISRVACALNGSEP
jgi:hypothetical protein